MGKCCRSALFLAVMFITATPLVLRTVQKSLQFRCDVYARVWITDSYSWSFAMDGGCVKLSIVFGIHVSVSDAPSLRQIDDESIFYLGLVKPILYILNYRPVFGTGYGPQAVFSSTALRTVLHPV